MLSTTLRRTRTSRPARRPTPRRLAPSLSALARRLYRKGAPLVVLLAACGRAYAQQSWMGIYFNGTKIGYTRVDIAKATRAGKPAYRVRSLTVTKMALLGQTVEQRIVMDQWSNARWMPLTMDFSMDSAGHSTSVLAVFGPKAVRCKVTSAGQVTTKIVPIPKGANLITDPTITLARAVKPGRKLRFHYLNPVALVIEAGTAEVLRREILSLGGVAYRTMVVRTSMPMGSMTYWQDLRGDMLKAEMVLGLTMLKETREEALSIPDVKYAPPSDVAEAIAVKAEKPIDNPRAVRHLKLRMSSNSGFAAVTDARQKVAVSHPEPTTTVAEIGITAQDVDPSAAMKLADLRKNVPAQLKEYLRPTPYLQATDPSIKSTAKQVVGAETNSFWAVDRLRDWVHRNMTTRADIGVLRSSVDIYKERVGVCRDYAILYAALARAAGIPTRLATGLVYVNGAFYYHAWAESYVGKWVDVDPTLPTAFVDATHVKLAHGDVASMFAVAAVMGNLKAEVLEYN